MISHVIQIRGNNGLCTLRCDENNALLVTDATVLGNFTIDGTFETNTLRLNSGFSSMPETAYAYFTQGSGGAVTGSIPSSSSSILTSLMASHAIQAPQFVAISDRRLKTDIRPVDEKEIVESIRSMHLKTWRFTDAVRHGGKRRLGFVAQEIPEPLAQYALGHHADYVPTIFRHATRDGSKERTYELEHHGLIKGDRIRVSTPTSIEHVKILDVPTSNTFTIDTTLTESLFVYGKYEDDIMSIDYDVLVAALVASHQSLEKRIAALETKE